MEGTGRKKQEEEGKGKWLNRNKTVCLLSGGIDSSTTLALVCQNYDVVALTFDYGQRHRRELESARKVAKYFNVKQKVFKIDLNQIGGSALTDEKIKVPKRDLRAIGNDVPPTYVPARNTIFLSIGVAYAEVIGAEKVFIGANAVDYSGYPDCRPKYFKAFQGAINLGTKAGIEGRGIQIEYPLIGMSKADIIGMGLTLKVPYELTWSCYRGGRRPCGVCDSCLLRQKGFDGAGIKDPLLVVCK